MPVSGILEKRNACSVVNTDVCATGSSEGLGTGVALSSTITYTMYSVAADGSEISRSWSPLVYAVPPVFVASLFTVVTLGAASLEGWTLKYTVPASLAFTVSVAPLDVTLVTLGVCKMGAIISACNNYEN